MQILPLKLNYKFSFLKLVITVLTMVLSGNEGQQLYSERSIIKQMTMTFFFFFHFQTQVDLYSFKVSLMTQYPFSELCKPPGIHWLFSFFFQSSAYWPKLMKWMNIHSMNDEEAGSMNSLVLCLTGVFLFRPGHITARHGTKCSFSLTD